MDTGIIHYVIDGALIAIALLAVYFGWKNGLIAALFSFLGLLASFAAAFFLSGPISRWIYNSFVSEKVLALVRQKLPDGLEAILGAEGISGALSGAVESLAPYIEELFSSVGLAGLAGSAEQNAQNTLDYIATTGVDAATAIAEAAVGPIILSLINAAVFIVIFIVAMILMRTLTGMAKVVNHIPLVGGLNRITGAIFGAAEGFVYIYLAAQALLLLVGLSGGRWQSLNGETLAQTKLAAWLLSIKLI